VYNCPANRFVAGFLGMPPMNFLEGSLVQRDGGTWFEGEGVVIRLRADQAECVAGKVGSGVVLGVRPEGMHLHPGADDNGNAIDVTVGVIEPLGSSMDMFVLTSTDRRMVARVKAESKVKTDEKVKMYLDLTKVHVFEPGIHGENLTLPAAQAAMA
jgi:multiple sugar transport system ATP-binding protein